MQPLMVEDRRVRYPYHKINVHCMAKLNSEPLRGVFNIFQTGRPLY